MPIGDSQLLSKQNKTKKQKQVLPSWVVVVFTRPVAVSALDLCCVLFVFCFCCVSCHVIGWAGSWLPVLEDFVCFLSLVGMYWKHLVGFYPLHCTNFLFDYYVYYILYPDMQTLQSLAICCPTVYKFPTGIYLFVILCTVPMIQRDGLICSLSGDI